MRRDFLKSLGIEDKETIDKILDENSADIGKAKGETEDLHKQIKDLESKLAKKTVEYDGLKESTKDYDDLSANNKQLTADNAQLIADKKQLEIDVDTKVASILKTHAIENSVRDAKARNVKAVMALLDMEKITHKDNQLSGLSEQLDTLKSGEDTAFLFGEVKSVPVGMKLTTPNTTVAGSAPTAKSWAEAVANAYANK